MKIIKKESESLINYIEQVNLIKTDIEKAVNLIVKTIKKNKKVLLCGNGGSASQADHMAAEMIVRLNPKNNRKPLPAISLTMDSATLTACINDFSKEVLFSRSIEALGNKNDLLIAISTSGNSLNILKAIQMAKKMKMHVLSFIGNDGGKQKRLSKNNLIIKGTNTARIQEVQLFLGHLIFDQVEKKIFK
jgi:D-sedoheptulose 7-phosphate isomerase